MPDVTHLDAAADEIGMCGFDVGDDQTGFGRAGRGRREPQAECDRCPGARGRELNDPKAVHRHDVIVGPPPQALVELLRPVDVGHGNDVHLEFHVDHSISRNAEWVRLVSCGVK
jgi:hypothetical protein